MNLEVRRRIEERDDLIVELYRIYLDSGKILTQSQIAAVVSDRTKTSVYQSLVRLVLRRRGIDTSLLRKSQPLTDIHGEKKVRQVITDFAEGKLRMPEAQRALGGCAASTIKRRMREMGLKRKRS